MNYILLQILKITGIILLIIIGVVIGLLLLIGIVPLRYKAYVKHREKELTEDEAPADTGWNVKGRISWLLHIVSAVVLYNENDGVSYRLRIFGIPVAGSRRTKVYKRKRSVQNKNVKISNKKEDNAADSDIPDEGKKDDSPEDIVVRKSDNGTGDNKIKNIRRSKEIFGGAAKKIKKVWQIIRNPDTIVAAKKIKMYLVKLLKHISPDKICVNMVIGTGDPCNTGYLFGIFGLLMGIWPGRYKLYPDFEQKIIEGDAYIKGKMYVYVLAYYLFKTVFDRDIQKVMKSDKE